MLFTCRLLLVLAAGVTLLVGGASAVAGDQTDPLRNTALPCELVGTQGGVARTAKHIVHVANVCGIVGTDVELQSRKDASGKVHDYAFVGTMGAGPRIFDVTDPAHPTHAGGYVDSGWENDVQVRGNVLLATYDGVNGEDSTASTCLKTRYPDAHGQGVDIYKLVFDAGAATFDVQLATCVAESSRRRAQRLAEPERQVARRSRTAAPTGRSTSSTCATSTAARRCTATA